MVTWSPMNPAQMGPPLAAGNTTPFRQKYDGTSLQCWRRGRPHASPDRAAPIHLIRREHRTDALDRNLSTGRRNADDP